MEDYQMVRDESREANEEVAELRRLLEEAEARREVVRRDRAQSASSRSSRRLPRGHSTSPCAPGSSPPP